MNMLIFAAMLPVFLTGEGAVEASGGMLDTIVGMVPKAFDLVGVIMNSIVKVDLFAFLIAVSLLSVGIGIFSRIRHSVT